MRKILLLNGPNLNMLGIREPDVYGSETLESLQEMVALHAYRRGALATCFQSNSEAELIDEIHRADGNFDGIVYNPGAHTHYSYALRDAIGSVNVPVVEVHISDIDAREPFRKVSVIAPACVAQVKGLGFEGYCRAVDVLCERTGLARLGEGYEARFPEGSNIVIAGEETIPEAQIAGVSQQAFEPQAAPEPQLALEPQPMVMEQPQMLQPSCEPQFIGVPMPQPAPEPQLASGPTPEPQPAPTQSAPFPQPVPTQAEPLKTAADVPQETTAAQLAQEPAAAQLAQEPTAAQLAQETSAAQLTPEADANAGLVSHERQQLVRAACDRLGIGAILVRDTSNIRWITAFDGVFDEERAHALLVAHDIAVLHTDSRYANAVRTVARRSSSDVAVNDERVSHAQFAKAQLSAADFAGRVGIEDTITYAEFVKMVEAFGVASLAATTDVVAGLRAVKSASEIRRMQAAQSITDAAFRYIVDFMRPGMTEREVQLELDNYMLRHGAEGLAFSTIVATGANGADPHAIPGDTRLEAGQCVVMDFGAKALGYCSDMTRTVFLGKPDARMESAWEMLRRANETAEAMLRPGVTGKQAHETAERVLAEGGFEGKMGHGLGHGVGLDVHELPVLNTRNEAPLVVGNVVTVEPGIYLPGEFGMRLEDCGVVTRDGYQPFSQLGHDMVVL